MLNIFSNAVVLIPGERGIVCAALTMYLSPSLNNLNSLLLLSYLLNQRLNDALAMPDGAVISRHGIDIKIGNNFVINSATSKIASLV